MMAKPGKAPDVPQLEEAPMRCTTGPNPPTPIVTPPAGGKPVGSRFQDYCRVSEIARRYPGGPVDPSTVTRHIIKGARRRDGSRLPLPAKRTPRGWVVSLADFEWFIERLTADFNGGGSTAAPAPPSARARAERAEAELDRRGVRLDQAPTNDQGRTGVRPVRP
jgi:hypothetical protein